MLAFSNVFGIEAYLSQMNEIVVPEETATTTSAPENSKKTASEGGGVSGAATTTVETGSSAANLAADEPTTSASRLPVVPATHRPVQLAPVAPGTIEGATQSKQSARAKAQVGASRAKEGCPDDTSVNLGRSGSGLDWFDAASAVYPSGRS